MDNLKYLVSVIAKQTIDSIAKPYIGYNNNQIQWVIQELQTVQDQQIVGLFVVSRNIDHIVFGKVQHWGLKIITDKMFVYLDFRVGQDNTSYYGYKSELYSNESINDFFYYKTKDEIPNDNSGN